MSNTAPRSLEYPERNLVFGKTEGIHVYNMSLIIIHTFYSTGEIRELTADFILTKTRQGVTLTFCLEANFSS
jgi:hypothetical protein